MSKSIVKMVAVVTGMILLAGCQKETSKEGVAALTPEDGISAEVSKEAEILEELMNAEADNTLDAYMAVAKVSLRIAADDKSNGEMTLGEMGSAVGNSRVITLAEPLRRMRLWITLRSAWDYI